MSVTCGLDFERRLTASTFDVRRSIVEAMRELGFEITVDQLTRIEAKRGGMLGYSLLMKKQMPVRAAFEITTEGTGTLVGAHLTDNIKTVGKTWGVNRQFREIFDEIHRRVDVSLAKLDGPASSTFEEPRFWSRSADIGVLEQTNALTAKAVGGAVGTAGKILDGSSDGTPKAWKGVDSVTFSSSAGVAVLTLAEAQASLGVAVLVVSHPGSMPANLTRDVETFAATVEQALTAAGGRAAHMEVSDSQRPVLEFLQQQAVIRSELPMRELHICRSCRLEKITNPEYERIAARNEKIGDLVAGVGATISKGGISPTFVLGQVFKLKRLDPEYVCSRCQGMEADERVVTFCPNCAELQRDVVLRVCPKCRFDFRTKAGQASLWAVAAEPAAVPELAAAEAEAAPPPEFGAEPVAAAPESFEAPVTAGPVAEERVAAVEPERPADAQPQPSAETWAELAAEVDPQPAIDRPAEPAVEPPPGSRAAPASVAPSPTIPTPPAAAPSTAPSIAPPTPVAPPPVAPPPVAAPRAPAPPAPPAIAVPPAPAPRVAPWPSAAPDPRVVRAWPHPSQVPLGRPPLGKRGKVCQMCRREYPSLWRVVISTPAGYEERFLCGSSATCQMPSYAQAILV